MEQLPRRVVRVKMEKLADGGYRQRIYELEDKDCPPDAVPQVLIEEPPIFDEDCCLVSSTIVCNP